MKETLFLLLLSSAAYIVYRGRNIERNPNVPKDVLELYNQFQWGKQPDLVKPVGDLTPPKWLVKLGDLKAVIYSSDKGGTKQDYIHEFKNPKPELASSKSGKKLFLLGGGYKINWRGIVG